MRYLILFLAFIAILSTADAQFKDYKLSEPIDISTVGMSRVLIMPNGNTMLFHIEPRDAIKVKVYDTSGKEIASKRYFTEQVRPRDFERSMFKGLFEINGEAVLFLSGDVANKETLVRVHFNSSTGKMIKEERVVRSKSFQNRTTCQVLRHRKVPGYAVFCMKKLDLYPDEVMTLIRFDEEHNIVKEVVVDINNKEYDVVNWTDAQMSKNGTVNISFETVKYIEYPKTFSRYFISCSHTKGASSVSTIKSLMNSELNPYYCGFTYNTFDSKNQLFLVNAFDGQYQNGLGVLPVSMYANLMMIYTPEATSASSYKFIENVKAGQAYLKVRPGADVKIELAPLKFYSDDYGGTLVVSEEHINRLPVEKDNRTYSLLGNISVTKILGDGKEVWGVMIPKKQMTRDFLSAKEVYNRRTWKSMFRGEEPEVDYANQYASFYSFSKGRSLYIMYNDHAENFKNGKDTVYNSSKVEAQYTVVNSKGVATKYMLYGKVPDEHTRRSCLIEGADFDEQRKVFASLILETIIGEEKDKQAVRLAWHYL